MGPPRRRRRARLEPLYVVDSDKKSEVRDCARAGERGGAPAAASDEDREEPGGGAAHLIEVLSPKVTVRRIVLQGIARRAIERALEQARRIDIGLVDAREARSGVLDRLYGCEDP